MTAQLPMLTLMSIIPACLLGAAAVGASLKNPYSELSFYLGLGVSLLGAFLACFWFWQGGEHVYSVYSVAALSPVITGTFALGRAVR
ncbi:MAG: hypothetical protein ACE37H_10480 [Phycisphaeraceae bacterium]